MVNFRAQTHVEGVHDNGVRFQARFDLHVIHAAWDRGCPFEREADGFGAGMGTHGDWSAVRDSTETAIARMYDKARRFLVARNQLDAATRGLSRVKTTAAHYRAHDAAALLASIENPFKSFLDLMFSRAEVLSIWVACTVPSLTDDQLVLFAKEVPSLFAAISAERARRHALV